MSAKKRCCTTCCGSWSLKLMWISGICSFIAVAIAIVLPAYIGSQIKSGILDEIVLSSEKSSGYKDWQSNLYNDSQPTYFQLYFFNITNADQVLLGEKPNLTEIGPYSYREYTIRFNVSWSDDGNIISYKTQEYFVFDPSTSAPGVSEDDEIVNVNLALVGARAVLDQSLPREWERSTVLRCVMCNTVGSTPFVRSSVKNYFWGHANDTVLSFVAKEFGIPMSTAFPPLQVNASTMDEAYLTTNIDIQYTGKNNLSQILEYIAYQNMTRLHSCTNPNPNTSVCPLFQREWTEEEAKANGWTLTWGSDKANTIFGTDGTQFPYSQVPTVAPVFVSATMKSFALENMNGEIVTDLYGLSLYRVRIPREVGFNDSHPGTETGFYNNVPDGLWNSSSFGGFPLYISKPHYLDGEPELINQLIGLNPSYEAHDTFVDIDGFSGVAMRARKRLQFSTVLTNWDMKILEPHLNDDNENENENDNDQAIPIDCVKLCIFNKTENWNWKIQNKTQVGLFIPFLWIDENEKLTADQASQYKEQIIDNQNLAQDVNRYGFVAFGCSGAFFLCSFTFRIVQKRKSKFNSNLSEPLREN